MIINKPWQYYYKQLLKFKATFGHCNVPYEWHDNPELSYWTEIQRTSKVKLTKVQFILLNEIDFDWKYEDNSWEAMYKRLKNYYNKHQHVMIDINDAENAKLRQWFLTQRYNYKTFGKEKKELFEFFYYKMHLPNVNDIVWETRFNELIEYKKEHGHCNVPQSYKANRSLASWVHRQRSIKDKLSEERLQRLTELGLEFGRREPTWEEMYKKLCDFKKEFGHTSPGQKNFMELGTWVISQRVLNNKNKLLPERKALLNAIDFDWEPMQNRWLKKYNGYKELFKLHKRKIPYHIIKETNYDFWLYDQRVKFEQNRLTEKQISLLKKVNVDLKRRPASAWEVMLEELIKFKKEHGHFNLFKKDIKVHYKKLAAWVDMQRKLKRKGLLAKERIEMLDAISFIWDGMAHVKRKGVPIPRKGRGFY